MIKLIATDMDGTLLDSNNNINPEFYEVFDKLKEKDIIFAAASGRQYYNLVERFSDIKDQMMFIAENGTFVMHKGKEILLNSLDKELALELIGVGQAIKNAYIILCGKKSAYISSTDKRFLEQVHKYYARVEIVDDLTKVTDDILKVTICDFGNAEFNSYIYFKNYLEKTQIAIAGEIWLDIMPKGVNKGLAITKLQEILDISKEETMVFGDYLNDLEMMDCAYYSYAMENAHEELKKIARFLTKSNDDNGVVIAIKEKLNYTTP